jgi:hypothetical protein
MFRLDRGLKTRYAFFLVFPAFFSLVLWTMAPARKVEAQESRQRAGLVVLLEDGRVETRCVAFTEPSLSGYELLLRSGLEVGINVAPIGAMVCTIEETGCPTADCLCQCRGGGSCVYWSYWRLEADGWQYSRAGASSSRVRDGVVEGWVWGPGSVSSASPPPLYTFEQICQATALPAVSSSDVPAPSSDDSRAGSYLVFGLIVTSLAAAWIVLRHRDNRRSGNEEEM